MKKTLIVIVIILALLGFYSWTSYNSLVTLRENTTAGLKQVDTEYQRRFDLIPNLVASTKGVLKQEQTIFDDIATARTHYSGAQTANDKITATNEVESSLGRLLAVVENYPTLKSSETVRDLMTSLEGTENRISVERSRFNATVKIYETTIQKFPKNIFASVFGFKDIEYYQAQTGAEVSPKVDLN